MSNEEKFWTTPMQGEFEKRMEDEHVRINHRISNLEKSVEEITKLAIALERLTLSVQAMVEEQKKQGARLSDLESADGEMWRKLVSHVITTIAGILIGYIFLKLGM
jgi:hypothetical protein